MSLSVEKSRIWTSRSVYLFLLVLLLSVETKIFCFQDLCLSLADLKPCKCLQNSIVCHNIRGKFDLENVSKILDSNRKNSLFAEISIYNTSIEKIGDVFKSVAFDLISITDNKNLSVISEKAFSGSGNNATVINVLGNSNFSNCSVNQSLVFDLMAQFNKIHYILMEKNSICNLSNRVFNSNPFNEFVYLNLRENNITRIESKTFIGLKRLKIINLGQNKINSIRESAFELSANITTASIFIDYNKLNSSSFAPNWFSLKSLNSSAKIDIDFSNNNIEFLDQHIFEPILSSKSSIILTVRYNPFKCDCRSKWLVSNKNLYKTKVRWMTCEDKKDIWLKTDKDFTNCSSK